MKKQKGITLVALIITIIVMLILVAVSTQVLIKSDLIGVTENAAERYKTAAEKEQTLSSDDIKIGDKTYDEYMQTICSHNFENGVCTLCGKIKTITATDIATAEDKTTYYGKYVTNYTCNDTAVRWKIFYAGTTPGEESDGNNIYLIADDYISWDNIGETLQGLLYKDDTYYMSFDNIQDHENYSGRNIFFKIYIITSKKLAKLCKKNNTKWIWI